MKKLKLFAIGGFLFLGTLALSSCGNANASEGAIYACPMACEGEKTYDEPGSCPVCGMDLEDVAEIESME